MRRASTSPSIQLFPFLAVLVCAMGALILLLLVTTRKMRQVAVARAAAEAEDAAETARPAIRPTLPPVPSGPTPEDLAAARAHRLAQREAAIAARKRQSARTVEWQRAVAEAEIALDQRRQQVAQSEQELTELRERLQATETNLQHLIDRKSKLKSELDQDSKLRAQAEQEHRELSAAIDAAQKQLAELRRAHADSASKFSFIPYDGASGTTRRPIYIECTSTGIRFQPENELLDEADLKGFTETFNPLLVASQRLMQYWREQSIATDDPRNPSRPYVLMLVRPKGTISYYVARKMLGRLGDDFGYELIEDDFALQLPPADPMAKIVIQQAVADTLKNRGEMLAAGSRVGEPRLGEVLMGRSEELIEFGTLDDQLAANIAQEESPFKKNNGAQGKSFAITRSPVQKDELASGNFKSSLAERDRRRAQGVPDSLAGMVGRDESTGSRGMGNGQGHPSGSGLGDPFSRDHLATGRSGPGSADIGNDRSERAAGDVSGTGGGTGAGTGPGNVDSSDASGARTASRGNSGIPAGAKAGRVIEIPANEANAGGVPSSAGRRTATAMTSPRRGAGGNTATGDATPTEFDADQGGDPHGSPSAGAASDSTSPRGAERGRGQSSGSTQRRGSGGGSGPPDDVETAFSKPQTPASDAVQHNAEGATGQRNDAPPGARGQRGGTKRSTDPNTPVVRQYGDNPEARKQLEKLSSSSASVTQKRDAGRRRWGGSNTGQIGFERKVNVDVTADRVYIERDDIEVIIEPGTTQDELVEAVLSALDEHSQQWGRPPTKFYWVPYLHFQVYSGGTKEYERLHGPLRDWGIFSESEFKTGERPPPSLDKGLVQPVSETQEKSTSESAVLSTKKKVSGSVEPPSPKATPAPTTPPKKSPFSWFKKLGTGK